MNQVNSTTLTLKYYLDTVGKDNPVISPLSKLHPNGFFDLADCYVPLSESKTSDFKSLIRPILNDRNNPRQYLSEFKKYGRSLDDPDEFYSYFLLSLLNCSLYKSYANYDIRGRRYTKIKKIATKKYGALVNHAIRSITDQKFLAIVLGFPSFVIQQRYSPQRKYSIYYQQKYHPFVQQVLVDIGREVTDQHLVAGLINQIHLPVRVKTWLASNITDPDLKLQVLDMDDYSSWKIKKPVAQTIDSPQELFEIALVQPKEVGLVAVQKIINQDHLRKIALTDQYGTRVGIEATRRIRSILTLKELSQEAAHANIRFEAKKMKDLPSDNDLLMMNSYFMFEKHKILSLSTLEAQTLHEVLLRMIPILDASTTAHLSLFIEQLKKVEDEDFIIYLRSMIRANFPAIMKHHGVANLLLTSKYITDQQLLFQTAIDPTIRENIRYSLVHHQNLTDQALLLELLHHPDFPARAKSSPYFMMKFPEAKRTDLLLQYFDKDDDIIRYLNNPLQEVILSIQKRKNIDRIKCHTTTLRIFVHRFWFMDKLEPMQRVSIMEQYGNRIHLKSQADALKLYLPLRGNTAAFWRILRSESIPAHLYNSMTLIELFDDDQLYHLLVYKKSYLNQSMIRYAVQSLQKSGNLSYLRELLLDEDCRKYIDRSIFST